MKEERHVIWSNYGLDYEDWRDDLEAEYPDLSENERISLMYEINGDYLDDERANLNVQLSQPILVVGDLGLWNGRRMGYKEIPSGNIRDCLYSDTDYSTWYVDRLGDLRCDAIHHDGRNFYLYRVYKDYSTDYEKLDTQALLQSVDAAKELKPDVILVMLHWGSEATLEVTKTQQSLAKQLFERGADAILGTHSHLVGKMETMDVTTDDGKDKTCFVAYSLGNFFSSQDSSYASGCESSVILNLQFTKNGETGETALTGVNYTPLYLMDRGSGADGAQYEILPIRTAIASGLFPDDTQTLTDAISRLRTRTESDFDSGK